jgi:hypothetical protein
MVARHRDPYNKTISHRKRGWQVLLIAAVTIWCWSADPQVTEAACTVVSSALRLSSYDAPEYADHPSCFLIEKTVTVTVPMADHRAVTHTQ